MPVTDQVQDTIKGSNRNAALAAAAAAAAGGAATFAIKRALSHDSSDDESGSGRNGDSGSESGGRGSRKSGAAGSILSSAAASSWDAASEVLIPMAEDVAESAGRYLAEHGPDVVKERIVPKFIEAFEDAK